MRRLKIVALELQMTDLRVSSAGNHSSAVVPSPNRLFKTKRPPDCSARPCTIGRPSPVPLPGSFVVKKAPSAVSYSNDRFGTSDNAGDWRRRYRIVSDDVLKRWPVSKRVNSSKAPADDID